MPALVKVLLPLTGTYLELGLGWDGGRDRAGVKKQEMSLEAVKAVSMHGVP